MRGFGSTLLLSVVLVVLACGGPEGSSRLSEEARSELEEVFQRFEEIAGKDFGDPAVSARASSELWNAKCDLVRWAIEFEATDSMWGNDCETDCWAEWWLCVDHCETDHQFVPFALLPQPGDPVREQEGRVAFRANDGLGHDPDSNDACWRACDDEHDRCLNQCKISEELKP